MVSAWPSHGLALCPEKPFSPPSLLQVSQEQWVEDDVLRLT